MIIPQFYYLDAATLSSATAVYLDELLTFCAPDGFYSDGVVTREMVQCSLLPEQICVSCAFPCPITNINSTIPGVFLFNVNTSSNAGFIKLKITGVTNFNPIGIRAIFQSNTYNKLVSPLDGVHQSSSPFNYTFVGDSANNCTPPISGQIYLLQNYIYNGIDFTNTGTTQSVTVNPFDVSLSTGNPDYVVMVIPKPFVGNSILSLYSVVPCNTTNTEYIYDIECNISLYPANNLSLPQPSLLDACGQIGTNAYYYLTIDGGSAIGLYTFLFYDQYGQYPVNDGFYYIDLIPSGYAIQVENGVIVDLLVC